MTFNFIRFSVVLSILLASTTAVFTQTTVPVAHYSATTANTSSAGDSVRFDLLRWSTDAERDQLVKAMTDTGATALQAALQKAPTIGYIWTTESAGYPLRYAYRVPLADGGDRIILAIDKPLGTFEPQRWKVSGTAKPTDYTFTVIELHLSKAGPGEGKASLTTKVIADKDAKTIVLENYAASPLLFQGVKK